ncbi:MAG: tetratricopeptide repeat protein [Pseudomonadota bacterium]
MALTIRTARREMLDGNLLEAGRLLDEALSADPDNPAIWVTIARLRFRGGEHLSAIEAADHALELGPQFGPALLMRGQLVRDSNGLAESLPWFEAAINADPENAEALGEYAATLGDLGRNGDMLDVLDELSAVESDNKQALFLRAVLAARAEKPVLARSLIERSGWRTAEIPAAILLDALVDLQQGNKDAAVETLAQLAKMQPANRRVRDLYARALWEAGRNDKLIAEMTPVAEGSDPSAYITMLVGRAHERSGDRGTAAALISKAYELSENDSWIALSPTSPLGGVLPGQTQDIRNSVGSGAGSVASGLKQRFPQSADVLALSGDAAWASGNAAVAITDYTKSARVRRPWPLTRKLFAASQMGGQGQAADALVSRYALSDPRNADAIISVMDQAKSDGQWERVAPLADYAIALGAGQDAKVLQARVEAAEGLGNTNKASQFRTLLDAVHPPKLVRE